jgi:hypothetical protein
VDQSAGCAFNCLGAGKLITVCVGHGLCPGIAGRIVGGGRFEMTYVVDPKKGAKRGLGCR